MDLTKFLCSFLLLCTLIVSVFPYCIVDAHAQNSPSAFSSQSPDRLASAMKLFGDRKYTTAAKEFEAVIKDNPDDASAHLYLAHSLMNQGLYTKAIKEFDWVAQHSKSISDQRSAQKSASTLRSYMKGICPGNCLRSSDPRWQRVKGYPPNELFIVFKDQDGLGYRMWSKNHLGETIKYVNGRAQNMGKCPICHGAGRVRVLKDGVPLGQ